MARARKNEYFDVTEAEAKYLSAVHKYLYFLQLEQAAHIIAGSLPQNYNYGSSSEASTMYRLRDRIKREFVGPSRQRLLESAINLLQPSGPISRKNRLLGEAIDEGSPRKITHLLASGAKIDRRTFDSRKHREGLPYPVSYRVPKDHPLHHDKFGDYAPFVLKAYGDVAMPQAELVEALRKFCRTQRAAREAELRKEGLTDKDIKAALAWTSEAIERSLAYSERSLY
jgi:hypothetical protein